MHRFGTTAHAVVIALEFDSFPGTTDAEFAIRAKLLRPVAWNAAADGEDANTLLLEQGVGEVVKVKERIEIEQRLAFAGSHTIVERDIEAELRISKCRNKNRHAFFKR